MSDVILALMFKTLKLDLSHITNNKADVMLKDIAYLHACVCKVELAGYLLARECCFSRLFLPLSGSSAAPETTSTSTCSPPLS